MTEKFKQSLIRTWLPAGVLAAAFASLLKHSWLKWGDLIIDTGRELYVPYQLSRGSVLYKDIFYLYGPFSPYCHAFLFKLFGVHLNVLVAGGILTAALMTFLIYKISRFFLNAFFSTLTALVFLYVCAFGHYLFLANYNFIIPYSYPAVHALLFSAAALYFFFRFSTSFRARDGLLSAAACFFALITRIEMGLMLIAALASGIALTSRSKRKPDLKPKTVTLLLGGPIILAALVYGGFWLAAFKEIHNSSLMSFVLTNTQAKNPFTAWLSGQNEITENILAIFKTICFYGLFAAWFFLSGQAVLWANDLKSIPLKRTLSALITAFSISAACVFLVRYFPFALQYRALPVIIMAAAGISFVDFVKEKDPADSVKVITLCLFSLLILLRIVFSVHPMHYGFSLLAPGIIIYHVFFFRQIPAFFQSKIIRRSIQSGFTSIMILFAFQHVLMSGEAYRRHTLTISTPRGTMRLLHTDKTTACASLVFYLLNSTAPDATAVVFPEGLTINFLSKKDNPLYYYSFIPPDFASPGIETGVIRDIEIKKIDYIILLQRDAQEYGGRAFGKDYARQLWAYVLKNYTQVHQIGNFPFTSPQFGVAVYQRNRP